MDLDSLRDEKKFIRSDMVICNDSKGFTFAPVKLEDPERRRRVNISTQLLEKQLNLPSGYNAVFIFDPNEPPRASDIALSKIGREM
jgi:hypothetical protein